MKSIVITIFVAATILSGVNIYTTRALKSLEERPWATYRLRRFFVDREEGRKVRFTNQRNNNVDIACDWFIPEPGQEEIVSMSRLKTGDGVLICTKTRGFILRGDDIDNFFIENLAGPEER